MTLSRTARILIGVLLLAAAAFFWVNFFSRQPSAPAPAVTASTPAAPVTTSPSPAGTPTNGGKAAPASTASGATPASGKAATQAAANGSGSNGSKGAVVAPNRPAVATHDLQVAELPFLVTQPPQPSGSGSGQTSAAGAASSGSTQVAASAQRMSVNPFSPIVVKAAAAPAASPTPPPTQKVTTQPAPAQKQPRQLAEAPAPQPVAPPPPQASGLPGATPEGMLPTTPSVLQTSRAVATSSAPKDLGSVAAVQVPGGSNPNDLGNVSNAGVVAAGPSVPDLLGPGQPTKPQTATAAANGSGKPPLQAGTDTLSVYLRDHNVRFTGTVLGPVSVGVFRSDQYTAPVVVSLGQDLPKTKITLTDLRGHEAVFSYQDQTQSLSLDLRR